MKQKITTIEIIIRFIVMFSALFFAYMGTDGIKQYLSLGGLVVMFFASLYLHRHFFPFVVMGCLFFLLASLQEVWSEAYAYLPITKFMWTAGNVLMPIGFLDLIYRITFKYKIDAD